MTWPSTTCKKTLLDSGPFVNNMELSRNETKNKMSNSIRYVASTTKYLLISIFQREKGLINKTLIVTQMNSLATMREAIIITINPTTCASDAESIKNSHVVYCWVMARSCSSRYSFNKISSL